MFFCVSAMNLLRLYGVCRLGACLLLPFQASCQAALGGETIADRHVVRAGDALGRAPCGRYWLGVQVCLVPSRAVRAED